MPIESTDDAKKYLANVHVHLDALVNLSLDAEMHSHAAIWLTIQAAFMSSMNEVKTISDMIGMYLNAKTRSMMTEYKKAMSVEED